MTQAYYRDADALLLLFDLTNPLSFQNIRVGPSCRLTHEHIEWSHDKSLVRPLISHLICDVDVWACRGGWGTCRSTRRSR